MVPSPTPTTSPFHQNWGAKFPQKTRFANGGANWRIMWKILSEFRLRTIPPCLCQIVLKFGWNRSMPSSRNLGTKWPTSCMTSRRAAPLSFWRVSCNIWKHYASVCLTYDLRFRFIHLMLYVVQWVTVGLALLPVLCHEFRFTLQSELFCYGHL